MSGRSGGRDATVSAAQHAALLQKYRALCEKYDALVQKHERQVSERVGISTLAFWSLKLITSAAALVQGSTIVLSNARFDAWAAHEDHPRGWRVVEASDPEHPKAPIAFRELVIQFGAKCILADGPHVWEVQREGDDTVLEVRCERLAGPGSRALVAVLAVEITERIKRQRELEEVRASIARDDRLHAVGELASGIAHDLNTMLSTLTLWIKLMENATTDARRHESIQTLRRVVRDATSMVQRLQEFGRPAALPAMEPFDLAAVASDAVELARGAIRIRSTHRGRPVQIATELRSARVIGSDSALRHALINLLINASDAMPGGGTVHVSVRADRGRALLQVRDEGTGIAPENLVRIFEPFFTTKGRHGVGLGLSNARRAVESTGGTISAANAEGGGAVFTVDLPLGPDAVAPSAGKHPSSMPPAGHGPDPSPAAD